MRALAGACIVEGMGCQDQASLKTQGRSHSAQVHASEFWQLHLGHALRPLAPGEKPGGSQHMGV